jgi:hypothetical protein
MEQIKESTVEIIQRIPEEKMAYVFNILKNFEKVIETPENTPVKKHTAKRDLEIITNAIIFDTLELGGKIRLDLYKKITMSLDSHLVRNK